MTFTLGNFAGLLPSPFQAVSCPLWPSTALCAFSKAPYSLLYCLFACLFLSLSLSHSLGQEPSLGLSVSPKPVHLNRYAAGPRCQVKNDPGLPVSQSQRRQLLSAEPVRTCLVSPEESVKKHDRVDLSPCPPGKPSESPPHSAPDSLSSSLISEHSNFLV